MTSKAAQQYQNLKQIKHNIQKKGMLLLLQTIFYSFYFYLLYFYYILIIY